MGNRFSHTPPHNVVSQDKTCWTCLQLWREKNEIHRHTHLSTALFISLACGSSHIQNTLVCSLLHVHMHVMYTGSILFQEVRLVHIMGCAMAGNLRVRDLVARMDVTANLHFSATSHPEIFENSHVLQYLGPDHVHGIPHLGPLPGVQSSRGNLLKVGLCHEVAEAHTAIVPADTDTCE